MVVEIFGILVGDCENRTGEAGVGSHLNPFLSKGITL